MEIILFVASILAGIAIFGASLFFLIRRILVSSSRWPELAQRFPCQYPPQYGLLRRQTMMVGGVQFRNAITVGITPEGLYLSTFMHKPDLMIPWTAFSSCRPTRLYWRQAWILEAGHPGIGTMTFPAPLFSRIWPYLGHLTVGDYTTKGPLD